MKGKVRGRLDLSVFFRASAGDTYERQVVRSMHDGLKFIQYVSIHQWFIGAKYWQTL